VFVHAVPDNRGKKDGYYCSLVESRRVDGVPTHVNRVSLGFVPSERLPYLRRPSIEATRRRSWRGRSVG
jgi:hypothetical protein